MKLMSYTSAMQQGFVPRLQSMMPQAPQGPSLAGGMLGVGVGQEGDGSLIPTPQGGAGGDALKERPGPGRSKRSPASNPRSRGWGPCGRTSPRTCAVSSGRASGLRRSLR